MDTSLGWKPLLWVVSSIPNLFKPQPRFRMTLAVGESLNADTVKLSIPILGSMTFGRKPFRRNDVWSIRRFADYDTWSTTTIGRKFVELRRNLVEN